MERMTAPFLAELDGLLKRGWSPLAPALGAAIHQVVAAFAESNGGYRGRYGAADRYYTDFAARLLDLCGGPRAELERIRAYLATLSTEPDLVHLFCELNTIRLLRPNGYLLAVPPYVERVLAKQRISGGGYGQTGAGKASAYLTFLATLIHELVAIPYPEPARTVAAVRSMRNPDGGFSDRTGGGLSQASTTAAAIAALGMLGGLDIRETAPSALFLASLQTPDGGIRAHPEAPDADLLSTFTALTSLAGLRALDLVKLAPLGRYVLGLRTSEGGFCGSLADSECDVEYTYYGVGSLCILQAHLNG